MHPFFKLFNLCRSKHYKTLKFELTYSHISDWTLRIFHPGKDNLPLGEWGKAIFHEQYIDQEYLFSKAHTFLIDYMNETNGGY
jgi:hypothetical protein